MEGAILGGKLAAEVIVDKAMGTAAKSEKKIVQRYVVRQCVPVLCRQRMTRQRLERADTCAHTHAHLVYMRVHAEHAHKHIHDHTYMIIYTRVYASAHDCVRGGRGQDPLGRCGSCCSILQRARSQRLECAFLFDMTVICPRCATCMRCSTCIRHHLFVMHYTYEMHYMYKMHYTYEMHEYDHLKRNMIWRTDRQHNTHVLHICESVNIAKNRVTFTK